MSYPAALDCDLSTGECPWCKRKGVLNAARNCPTKRGTPLPGTELRRLIREIGVKMSCRACAEWERQMNQWGAECREHRAEIVQRLKDAAREADWATTFAAMLGLATAPWWSPLDRFGSIVDEAIRRAEAQ